MRNISPSICLPLAGDQRTGLLKGQEGSALDCVIEFVVVSVAWEFDGPHVLNSYLYTIVALRRRDPGILRQVVISAVFQELLAGPRRRISLRRRNISIVLHQILVRMRVERDWNVKVSRIHRRAEQGHYDQKL